MIKLKNIWINKTFLTLLEKIIPKLTKKGLVKKNEIIIKTTRANLLMLLDFLKNHMLCSFEVLTDIVCYDLPSQKFRFPVLYNLLSVKFNSRIFVNVFSNEHLKVPTTLFLYSSANWFEREAWDMFGIFFENHPDLRRILTDYGFSFHPLRKDYPLTGYKEVHYSDNEKRIIHSSVETTQAYRTFYFKNSWVASNKLSLKTKILY